MKLWLVYQDVNTGYGTYDSAVVAAETEIEARQTHPSGEHTWKDRCWSPPMSIWAEKEWASPEEVRVHFLGVAKEDLKAGVVCASFNAD